MFETFFNILYIYLHILAKTQYKQQWCKEFSDIYPLFAREFITNIIDSQPGDHVWDEIQRNPNYILWILDEMPWFQPFTRFGLHFVSAPATNCICESNFRKLSTYNTPQRNRMLPETLNDHDEIHQRVLNEYSNSKLKKKYLFTSEIILDIIERSKIRRDVPGKYKQCLIDIQEKKVQTSSVWSKLYIYIQ